MKRKIIKIDEEKCNGCGLCIPNCPEGALKVIDGKLRLVSDLFCDGLGACIGHCPTGAITIEAREAEPYDEKRTMANIAKHGENVIQAHLVHLKEHNQGEYLSQAIDYLKENGLSRIFLKIEKDLLGSEKHSAECPGTKIIDSRERKSQEDAV